MILKRQSRAEAAFRILRRHSPRKRFALLV
jgi:hypothetical protein